MDIFLDSIFSMYELLNKGAQIHETMDYIFDSFKKYIPYDRVGLVLLGDDSNLYSYDVHSNHKSRLKEGYSLSLAETSLKILFQTKQYRIINNYAEYLKLNPNSVSTKLILEESIMSSLAYPVISNNLSVGAILFSSKEPNAYKEEHLLLARAISNNVGVSVEKNLLVDDLIFTSIIGFARLVEAKDSETGMHIERMQNYSKIVATELAKKEKYKNILNVQFIEDIYKFSSLHDIGKVGIADGILLKPIKLSPEEFEVMKKHTVIGADVLRKASNNLLRNGRHFFDTAIEIAEGHHEKYNGMGYPYGLAGDEIPIAARIVSVVDVFDALTSKRVYKNAFAINVSLEIINGERGASFDPDIVDALNNSIEKMIKIYEMYQESIDIDKR